MLRCCGNLVWNPSQGFCFTGCGKTMLVSVIGNEARVPFYNISATDLVSGVSGASEENIRELFSKALRNAPSIIFIDAIASKKDNVQRETEGRIVAQLMTCMIQAEPADRSKDSESSASSSGYVLVIGATSRLHAIDPALRRPGRFDLEICLGVPNEEARVQILTACTCNLKLDGALDPLRDLLEHIWLHSLKRLDDLRLGELRTRMKMFQENVVKIAGGAFGHMKM